jgi:1-deoxy-D-xylulose-5-phosphate reductoisomerase
MAIPIAYTLSWPERMKVATPRLNLAEIGTLAFEAVEDERFPALALAREAMRAGSAHMIALNAANEVAVEAFLNGRITFTDIAQTVARVVESQVNDCITTLDDVITLDHHARTRTLETL